MRLLVTLILLVFVGLRRPTRIAILQIFSSLKRSINSSNFNAIWAVFTTPPPTSDFPDLGPGGVAYF